MHRPKEAHQPTLKGRATFHSMLNVGRVRFSHPLSLPVEDVSRLSVSRVSHCFPETLSEPVFQCFPFNAVQLQRAVDAWIEARRQKVPKKGGPPLGVLVHGNRILAAAVFKALGPDRLSQPIEAFRAELAKSDIDAVCEGVYLRDPLIKCW
jgi:hypothetical protein